MAGTFNIRTLAIGQITGSSWYSIYTPSTSAVVKSLVFVNTLPYAVTINIAVTNGSLTARLVPPNYPLDGYSMIESTLPYTLSPNASISANASIGNAVDFSLHGVEEL